MAEGGGSAQHILVKGGKTGLPFSKGLMASSVLATGVEPGQAYRVAEQVEQELFASGTTRVTVDDLREVTADILERELGSDAATRYRQWQKAQERDLPLLILIGGPTGAGKSTVAAQVAQRLGITRIISTDAIRDVMRATIGAELLPSLHVSSFETAEAIAGVPSPDFDLLLGGFLRQTQAVTVGVEQILERAVEERVDTMIEGVHLVPGAIKLPDRSKAIVVHVLLTVEESDRHRSHLSGRSQEQPARQFERYLEHFGEIRRIQDELLRRAEQYEVPTVASYALDQTVASITSLIVDEVTRRQLRDAEDLESVPSRQGITSGE